MQFFVGIDVSLETSSICIIDERGVIIKEGNSIAQFIRHRGRKVEHIGPEAGQLSKWLFVGLFGEGFNVSVLESRHRLPSNGRFTGDVPPEHRYEADLRGSTAESLRI